MKIRVAVVFLAAAFLVPVGTVFAQQAQDNPSGLPSWAEPVTPQSQMDGRSGTSGSTLHDGSWDRNAETSYEGGGRAPTSGRVNAFDRCPPGTPVDQCTNPPGSPAPGVPGPQEPVPLDGGIALLGAAGATYAWRRLRGGNGDAEDEDESALA